MYGDARMFQTQAGAANWIDPSTQPEEDIWRALISSHVGISALGTLWHRRSIEKVGPWDEGSLRGGSGLFAAIRLGRLPICPLPRRAHGLLAGTSAQKTENSAAIAHGIEAVWSKALGYVTLEPYRGLIAAELARHRLSMALSRDISKQEALSTLALARASSPETVPMSMYVVTRAAILVPALRVRWLRKTRRWVLDRFGFGTPEISAAKVTSVGTPGARQ